MSRSLARVSLLISVAVLLLSNALVFAAADRHVVELWTVEDVGRWVNYTVGYPEYASHFAANLVDGPTLLNLDVEDIEDAMPITNRIHIAKFKGHLQIVKDQCLCKLESMIGDFWSHLRLHPTRTWVLGSAAIFAPRAALIGAYFFDGDLYEAMTSTTVEGEYVDPADAAAAAAASSSASDSMPRKRTGRTSQQFSWLYFFAYWVLGMLCPSAYMLLNFLPFIGANFIVVPVLSINFIVEQHREVFLLMSFLYGDMRSRSVKEILMALIPFPTFFPLAGLVLSFFAPIVLLQIAVVALMLFTLFIGVGFVMMLLSHEEGAADEEKAKKEAAERAAAAAAGSNTNSGSAAGHAKVD